MQRKLETFLRWVEHVADTLLFSRETITLFDSKWQMNTHYFSGFSKSFFFFHIYIHTHTYIYTHICVLCVCVVYMCMCIYSFSSKPSKFVFG